MGIDPRWEELQINRLIATKTNQKQHIHYDFATKLRFKEEKIKQIKSIKLSKFNNLLRYVNL